MRGNKKIWFQLHHNVALSMATNITRSSSVLSIPHKRVLVWALCTEVCITLTTYSRTNNYQNKPLQSSFAYCHVASLYVSLGDLTQELRVRFWVEADNQELASPVFRVTCRDKVGLSVLKRTRLDENLTPRFPLSEVFLWPTLADVTVWLLHETQCHKQVQQFH